MVIAGEASADFHGANLVRAMKAVDPSIVFWGIGGERMEEAGVRILFYSSEMAVVGLTEVLTKLRTIFKASRRLKNILRERATDLLVLIDYPDFNIYLAGMAKRYGVPVLYYIGPQVWAWRRGRVKKISKRVDRMAVILPFEEEFYGRNRVRVEYVGHPLLDAYQPVSDWPLAREMNTRRGYPVLGLLPGSRREEIKNLLPAMVGAAEMLGEFYPGLRCILPVAPTIDPGFLKSFVEDTSVNIECLGEGVACILRECDAALVTSGTATLEAAIMGVPMVVVYRVSPISYWLGKMVIKVPYIGLVNLIAGEEVAPEFIQGEVTAVRLAREVRQLLEDVGRREEVIRKLEGVRRRLGNGTASEKTARIALQMVEESR